MQEATIKKPNISPFYSALLQLGILCVAIGFISQYNFLFFHALAEIISVIIAAGIFVITWNSRRFVHNHYYLFIGIAFLFIGSMDLIHSFVYKGTNIIFATGNSNNATQLWIASRYLTALSFLIAPFFVKRKIDPTLTFLSYLAIFISIVLSIFYWKIFPAAYIDGHGLTNFKIISEYIISFIFLLALLFLYSKRESFNQRVFWLLSCVMVIMIVSELLFTLYVGVYDLLNILGHVFKVASFYISYLAIIEIGLRKPFRLLFKELKDSEMQLGRERNKVISILDAMADGVCMVNQKFEIEYANPALIKQFGPMKTNKCYQYLHDRQEACPWCKNHEIFKGKSQSWEWTFEKNNRTYDLIDSPVFLGKKIVAKLETFHDITERKELEKSKDEFISLASHQLRTPLASISLSAELMLREIAGEISSEQKNYINEIYQSTRKMNNLVTNLLNVSRIEMGTLGLEPEPISLTEAIKDITNNFSLLFQEKKINLVLELEKDLPILQFNGNVFRLILENLISNALRYTAINGEIKIKAYLKEDELIIEVADTGCGIPKDQQDQIFNKSFRAKNAIEMNAEGTGLGLYMTKAMIDKTGSRIWLKSEENKGTTFYVAFKIRNLDTGL